MKRESRRDANGREGDRGVERPVLVSLSQAVPLASPCRRLTFSNDRPTVDADLQKGSRKTERKKARMQQCQQTLYDGSARKRQRQRQIMFLVPRPGVETECS